MAGTSGSDLRAAMRQEYVDSVFENSYSLCIRGAGNWSYRFFEALSAGRIPVLLDTDCALPLEASVQWDRHVCRIPLKQIKESAAILNRFHRSLGPEGHARIQVANRRLWVDHICPAKFFVNALRHTLERQVRS